MPTESLDRPPGMMVGSGSIMKSLLASLLGLFALAGCEHGKGGGMVPTDGGSGVTCGGFAGTTCLPTEWCDFGRNDCGSSDGTGTCKPRPVACDDSFDPVCGCDGTVHSNECDAQAAGFDLSVIGSCRIEPGAFQCGERQCDLDTEYCQVVGNDVGNQPDSFSCVPLPVGCGVAASCACLAGEPCGGFCDGDAASGLTALCPGG